MPVPPSIDDIPAAERVLLEEVRRLDSENANLRKSRIVASNYLRDEVNRFRQVMGASPLKEEFDDDSLIASNPIGTISETLVELLQGLQETSDALNQTRMELQGIFEGSGCGILVVNKAYKVLAGNSRSKSLFGEERLEGRSLHDIFPEQEETLGASIVETILKGGKPVEQGDFSFGDRYMHVAGTPVVNHYGKISSAILFFTDITDRKKVEAELNRTAWFDRVTGLPNRYLLEDRITQALTQAERFNEQIAVMCVDLDRFKEINVMIGREQGDKALKIVADRRTYCIRKTDTVARIGADEFAILLTSVSGKDGVIAIAQNILNIISSPFDLGERDIFMTGSLGLTISPDDGTDAETLLKHAEVAMGQAQQRGENGFCAFSKEMCSQDSERLQLGNDLRRALERRELALYYQPQLNVTSGKMIGMEALLRWKHPELGLVSPAQFIPLAEETGLIIPIGQWVLHTACAQNKEWQKAGYPPIRVAVNLSGRQLQAQGMVDMVREILEETGLDPDYLELELTETVLVESAERNKKLLRELKDLGVHLAIDDFGTGYSSLNYLKHFPIDRLKIDRSFVNEITENTGDATIAEAIIHLAQGFNIRVLAEGVETREQLEFLPTRRCEEMQGYYFSQPVSTEVFTDLLKSQSSEEEGQGFEPA